MNYNERKKRLQYLLEMIEKGRCQSLDKIAIHFNCSKNTAKRMLVCLRNDGHNITYCKVNRKFSMKK